MAARYDAAVIGAGLGGLTAAARLLTEGLSVLVVDRGSHPGGTADIYSRNGFGFPMGPMGFSNPDLVRKFLLELGVEEEVAFNRVHYRLRAFGLEAPLSLPFPAMITELASLFPREEAAISRFFSHMAEISGRRDDLVDRGSITLRRNEIQSAASYLYRLVSDARLRRILGSMGSREPYSGLPLLAAMWDLLCRRGIHYPERGLRHFTQTVAGRVSENRNGAMLLRSEVAAVVVRDGRAAGLTLADGETVEAGAVISNADHKTTFLRLLPPAAVPAEFRRAVSDARQAGSNLQVALGIDASRADLSAFDRASRVVYRRGGGFPPEDTGPDWSAAEIDPSSLAGEELELCLLSRDDPTLAPAGCEVLVIRVGADHDHFTRLRPAWGERLPTYLEYKEKLARALVEEAAVAVPGLARAVIRMDVATPLTFEERGGRSGGAVAGWSWDFGGRGDTAVRELVLTPVSGLYMAGYEAFSMLSLGGVPSAMASGLKAAEYLLEGAGPTDEINIPG